MHPDQHGILPFFGMSLAMLYAIIAGVAQFEEMCDKKVSI